MRPYVVEKVKQLLKSEAQVTSHHLSSVKKNVRYIFHVEHIADDETENIK